MLQIRCKPSGQPPGVVRGVLQRVNQAGEQQAKGGPGGGHAPDSAVFRGAGRDAVLGKEQGPATARTNDRRLERESGGGAERRFVRRPRVVEQLGGRRFLAVERLQPDALAFERLPFPQNALHEVIHPVRAIDPALEGGAPFGDGGDRHPLAVHRDKHQGARLDVGGRFLDQLHFAGEGGGVFVPRPFQGRAAHGFGEHVVTERAEVAVSKRFQVDNAGINRPLALRPHPVIREALLANLLDVLRQTFRRDEHRVTYAMDARQLILDLEMLDESAPLGTGHPLRSGKKCHPTAQNLLRVIERISHLRADFAAGEVKLAPGRRHQILLRMVGGEAGDNEARGEQQQRGPSAASLTGRRIWFRVKVQAGGRGSWRS